jgi:ferric-dicitrate binding protein FerR (iron transport regulator)
MTVAEQLTPYVNRLFDDDSVREQLGDALVRSRRAYRRARDEKAAEAVTDKRLMEHLTGAPASLQGALRALTNQPPPKPKRRRRTALLFAAAVAAGAVAIAADRRSSSPSDA